MIYVLIVIFILIFFIMFVNLEVRIKIYDKIIDVHLILFKVIKLCLYDKTKKRTGKKAIRKVDNINYYIKFSKETYPETKYILSKTKVLVNFTFTFGLESADKTAMLYGMINAILQSMNNIFKYIFKSYEGKYIISPNFNNAKKDINTNISIKVRPIYILIKLFKIIKKNKKIKKGGALNARTSNRRANENYNG